MRHHVRHFLQLEIGERVVRAKSNSPPAPPGASSSPEVSPVSSSASRSISRSEQASQPPEPPPAPSHGPGATPPGSPRGTATISGSEEYSEAAPPNVAATPVYAGEGHPEAEAVAATPAGRDPHVSGTPLIASPEELNRATPVPAWKAAWEVPWGRGWGRCVCIWVCVCT